MKIVIVGAGYVGLVSGCCFAEFGAEVTCVDVDEARITALLQGHVPIYEPGLQELLSTNAAAGRLNFTTDFSAAVPIADLVFIAVGTPTRRGDGHADLSFVFEAASQIGRYLSGYTVVVDKSTVPVGTARRVHRIIREINPTAEFDVASNPEFLREGAAIADFMRPDRVVIGADSSRADAFLRELYRPLNLIEVPIVSTDLESAELIKYASNAFLATKISFINEMSMLCEKVGADIHAVAKGMGLDGRIGKKFLHPGPGYGGSCFPKDTEALVRTAQEFHVSSRIVQAVIDVNSAQKARMIDKITQAMGGDTQGKRIAILGLTFKPETDDMREAPSLTILPELVEKGALVCAHDPQGMEVAAPLLPSSVTYHEDIYHVLRGADAVVLMTEWNQYRGLNLRKVLEVMHGNVFIDLRNVYDRPQMADAGFAYHCVGR